MNFIEHILEPPRLLLVWQGPEGSSRTRRTVAELLRPSNGPAQFRYLTETPDFASACAEGFINYPAFRKVDQEYDLGVVETFVRRLPPRTRGDYAQYLEQFRLRPDAQVSDFALLAYTGAKLPSDGFSIVNPLEDVETPAEVLVEVAGFRHASRIPSSGVQLGDAVSFVHEPDNSKDVNATAVFVGEQKIGYVPRQQAASVLRLSSADLLRATVERINGRPERPLIYLFVAIDAASKAITQFHNTRELA